MKRFYVEIENNVIKNPAEIEGKNVEEIEISEPFREVTEEFYIQYKDLLPATFELDAEGNIVNITPLPRPDPAIEDEDIDDEKIAMAEAIIDLNMRIEELENRLNGGV